LFLFSFFSISISLPLPLSLSLSLSPLLFGVSLSLFRDRFFKGQAHEIAPFLSFSLLGCVPLILPRCHFELMPSPPTWTSSQLQLKVERKEKDFFG
jgi:hypothetical protein